MYNILHNEHPRATQYVLAFGRRTPPVPDLVSSKFQLNQYPYIPRDHVPSSARGLDGLSITTDKSMPQTPAVHV